jgi:hypothetical protein
MLYHLSHHANVLVIPFALQVAHVARQSSLQESTQDQIGPPASQQAVQTLQHF